MSINIEDITSGNLNGKKVWICDYRRPDLNKKPARNLKPTLCMIVSNDELPKGKTIYYSKSHFRALNKKGEPSGRAIPVFDNTGYRSFTGIPVHAFYDQAECFEHFQHQVYAVIDLIDDKIKTATDYWKGQKSEALELLY